MFNDNIVIGFIVTEKEAETHKKELSVLRQLLRRFLDK